MWRYEIFLLRVLIGQPVCFTDFKGSLDDVVMNPYSWYFVHVYSEIFKINNSNNNKHMHSVLYPC